MRHFQPCIIKYPECPCNTCERDSYMYYTDEWNPCCQHKKHRKLCNSKEPCPDYVVDKKARPRREKKVINMTCESCGNTFSEPITVYEDVGEHFGFPCREPWEACPYCRSTDITEEGEESE